jgi:uncharacterized membrane protein YfcA
MLVLLLLTAGFLVGTVGALLGIGGGVLLVPILVLGFGVPMAEAVPASLLCVVASSCGAAASYVEHKLADIRLALSLELATVSGAIAGGWLAVWVAPAVLALCFGVFTFLVAAQFIFGAERPNEDHRNYVAVNYPLGFSGSFVAGGLSALLGVGGGPLKVPLMNVGMKVPFKVASATSNLMIGVTAGASAVAYAWHGQLNLALVAPLIPGVLLGAVTGSRFMLRARVSFLRKLFAIVLLAIAAQMLWKGGHSLWLTAP